MKENNSEKTPETKAVQSKKRAQKPAGFVAPPGMAEMKEPEAKRVNNYRSHAKKVVSGNFAKIMKTMAEKSESGSLSHTKYLFEIGGVKEDIQRRGQGRAEPSLAELLLAEVRKRQIAEDTEDAEKAKAAGK